MAEKRSALIVATSEYEDARLSPLGGPGEDAEALEKVLADAEIGGFDVQLALNAHHDVLRTTLEGFFTDRGRDDLLLVHFSGHGLKDDDGQLYLAAADTRIDRLMSTGIEAGWVNRLMNRCRSEKIALFLDCCFGGAFTTGLARRAGVDTAGAKETFGGTGRFVITASDAMQYSFESGERVDDTEPQPSPFTGALVQGLVTGEADRNEDGFVSINELFDYLEDRVRQLSPAQTPTKSAFNQVGDWVIASSTRAPTIRILPASVQTQLKSEDALDRLAALIDLQDLIRGSDPRVADAAMKALEKLTGDDSRRVAAAASRLFGDVPGGAVASGAEAPTMRLSESNVPDAIKAALVRPAPEQQDAPAPPTAPAQPAPAEPPPRSPLDAARTPTVTSPATTPAAPAPPTLVALAPQPVVAPAPQPVAPPPSATSVAPATQQVAQAAPPAGALWASSTAPSASPRPAALWNAGQGPAPVPLASSTPASAPIVRAPTHDRTWSAGRAAGRAAIGVILAVIFEWLAFFASDPLRLEDSTFVTDVTSLFTQIAIWFTIVAVIGAVGLGAAFPALRLPGGSAYRIVGHNRWIAAAIAGALVGLVVGVPIETLVVYQKFGDASLDFEIVVYVVIGYLIAEAAVGRRGAAARSAA